MSVVLNAGERLLGSKINFFTGGKTYFIGEIGKRGATRTIETNPLGHVIHKASITPNVDNVLAYFNFKKIS